MTDQAIKVQEMKVFIYKMHAGHCGTDETLTIVSRTPLSSAEEGEYVYDHATSYQEQDEDGEWEEGDPEIYLDTTFTSGQLEEFKEYYYDHLIGNETMEEKLAELAGEGMLWT